ncbi:MAG: hypothetical protein U9Q04_05200 [Campylobacterota bacterium]|nr:hypothetical protein [Campylobacterota bacterium]
MNKYILLIITVILNITMLNATELEQMKLETICSNSKEFTVKINTNKLNLSEDAVQDNLGGYVDIPEDSYYIKTNNTLYYLDGVVIKRHKENINQFIFHPKEQAGKFLNIQELYSLKNRDDLKFIQKINLKKDQKAQNTEDTTTTNSFYVYFDKKRLEEAYKKCK